LIRTPPYASVGAGPFPSDAPCGGVASQALPSLAHIDGLVAPGFERVADAFRENFTLRGELGAAVAVYRGAECVVDLWGGVADRTSGAPWRRDTVVLVFSTTKGMAALALAVAHARGLFDYEAPVSRYWPEFAQQGKQDVTVRQLLGHQAGLAAIDERLTPEVLADPDRRDAAIARQRPWWRPGERHGYHAMSLGFYEAALLRRCDPQGRGVGAYFADEIARPLGLEFWIGLAAGFPHDRVARIVDFGKLELLRNMHTMPRGFVLRMMNPWSLTARAFTNPRLARPSNLDAPAYWQLEFPSSTGVGEVRALARAYAELASGGDTLGVGRATRDALAASARIPRGGAYDLVMCEESAFSLGFSKPAPGRRFGSSDRAYGTPGAGGSFAFADPDHGLGFAYAPNKMGFHTYDDPRETALRDAVYRCLERPAV
jgi:CubicO group peptidase (beta-lactamase class C family)